MLAHVITAALDNTLAAKITNEVEDIAEMCAAGPDDIWMDQIFQDWESVIYVKVFVDARGNSPTPTELRLIVSKLREYAKAENDDAADRIDNAGRNMALSSPYEYLRGGRSRAEKLLNVVCCSRADM